MKSGEEFTLAKVRISQSTILVQMNLQNRESILVAVSLNGQLIARLRTDHVYDFDFAPEGDLLISFHSRAVLMTLQLQEVCTVYTGTAHCACFSSKNLYLATDRGLEVSQTLAKQR